jgi:hypothetical protein
MSPVTIDAMKSADAERRRAEIIAAVGGDETSFRRRADRYLLDADELALYDELTGIDYLLEG